MGKRGILEQLRRSDDVCKDLSVLSSILIESVFRKKRVLNAYLFDNQLFVLALFYSSQRLV